MDSDSFHHIELKFSNNLEFGTVIIALLERAGAHNSHIFMELCPDGDYRAIPINICYDAEQKQFLTTQCPFPYRVNRNCNCDSGDQDFLFLPCECGRVDSQETVEWFRRNHSTTFNGIQKFNPIIYPDGGGYGPVGEHYNEILFDPYQNRDFFDLLSIHER